MFQLLTMVALVISLRKLTRGPKHRYYYSCHYKSHHLANPSYPSTPLRQGKAAKVFEITLLQRVFSCLFRPLIKFDKNIQRFIIYSINITSHQYQFLIINGNQSIKFMETRFKLTHQITIF